ncbi:hypothetical protein [Candidatus Neptunochlamydia vexilliferae]|uniref:Uncharacterized protein n=1 Tax=Candidatus Neptunichlamydia vexilliferae TaxID=1651774 RepID=A0ABS0B117_9BACT|nr:hypothetical protein [Candidatus Neptunochlamydia vexilliferae]MBF5060061.1 hypothetical protein [Candidatus Neptunochlamydia vexilliferae]
MGSYGNIGLNAMVVDVGMRRNKIDQAKHEGTAQKVEGIGKELRETILVLKRELTAIKGRHPDGNNEDGTFDISKESLWDKILDFQDIHHSLLDATGKEGEKKPRFGRDEYEKTKSISKTDLEQLIHEIEDLETDRKNELQMTSQQLFLDVNMSLLIFDAINKALQAGSRHQERIAQNTRAH